MTERFILDLTGPRSHVLMRQLGNNGVTIGPAGCNLNVGENEHVNWDALDHPELVAMEYPGRVRYEGGDAGIAPWVVRRGVNSLEVIATRPLDLDLSDSQLQFLTLEPRGHPITVHLPSGARFDAITLVGNPDEVTVIPHADGNVPHVMLHPLRIGASERKILPADGSEGARSFDLPAPLRDTNEFRVFSDPFDIPFDARMLRELPRLRKVGFHGAVAYLDALADLPLTMLEFRYVPDLTGLPPLSTWPDLDWVVVWNSDATATTRVRAEIRKMPPGEGFRSASKGRGIAWFTLEYGLPFSAWPTRTAARAKRAFTDASKRIATATTREECLDAVEDFVRAANTFPGIETSEREDLGEAVWMLSQLTDHPRRRSSGRTLRRHPRVLTDSIESGGRGGFTSAHVNASVSTGCPSAIRSRSGT